MLKEKCIEASETITYDGVYVVHCNKISQRKHDTENTCYVANFSDESGL